MMVKLRPAFVLESDVTGPATDEPDVVAAPPAEWLRYQVATVDDPPNQPPEGSECIYLTNEFVIRMRSIADRLERPGVLAKLDERCGGWKLDWDLLPTDVLRVHMGVEPFDGQFVKVFVTPAANGNATLTKDGE